MSPSELRRWEPLAIEAVVELFSAAPFRWWISGGKALDLHLGRTWREHEDVDVGVLRRDLGEVYISLPSWDLHVAANGQLSPSGGERLEASEHQNNIWCRLAPDGPWVLDIAIGEVFVGRGAAGQGEFLTGSYDCVDRLNAYFSLGHRRAGSGYGGAAARRQRRGSRQRPPDAPGRAVLPPGEGVGEGARDSRHRLQERRASCPTEPSTSCPALPIGATRVGGIDLKSRGCGRPWPRVAALSAAPDGFTVADLALKVQAMTGQTYAHYTAREAPTTCASSAAKASSSGPARRAVTWSRPRLHARSQH